MKAFGNVLCLCPSSRLSTVSLVLSTWTNVEHYVLTDDVQQLANAGDYDAVIVMDAFVTRELVARVTGRVPVVVLAWNGLFEITRYREVLTGLDVIYMGTDEALGRDGPENYLPMTNAHCGYAHWRSLYQGKRQFRAIGGAGYRARWLRVRAQPMRAVNVAINAAGSFRRPRVLMRTLESGLVRDKLVWAGNCYLDFPSIGLTAAEQASIELRIADVRAVPEPSARLRAALQLIRDWQAEALQLGAERAHSAFYVTNTLLRWAVLAFLSSTAPASTWFFGRDNMGLELELELYVHNLVSKHRVAFLEFGGKTAATGIAPRILHMLASQFYVIAIGSPDSADVPVVLERVRSALAADPRGFFQNIERRRKQLYATLPETLNDVYKCVWTDFTV